MTPEQLDAFAFSGKNTLWEQINKLLDDQIEEETIATLDVNTLGEYRAHAAGRAEGLSQFKRLLLIMRDESLQARGIREARET